jgi:hypothetical protein
MTPSKSDRIAICGEYLPRALKHRFLFFDRIGVVALENTLELLRRLERFDDRFDLADLEFRNRLVDRIGVVAFNS